VPVPFFYKALCGDLVFHEGCEFRPVLLDGLPVIPLPYRHRPAFETCPSPSIEAHWGPPLSCCQSFRYQVSISGRGAALGGLSWGFQALQNAFSPRTAQLADGVLTRFTVAPGQPAVFTYIPPKVGDKSVPFQAIDDTSRWVRVNAHAQRTPLTVTVALPPKPTKT
jgi:hypothetical protein